MKKVLSVILSAILVLSAFPIPTLASDNYHLWIAGIEVDSANAADVLGDGKVVYDRATNTLTLDNATIVNTSTNEGKNCDCYGFCYEENTPFNVVINGVCSITARDRTSSNGASVGFYSSANVNISGNGTLNVYSAGTVDGYSCYGVCVNNELSINGITLNGYAENSENCASYGIYCNSLSVNTGKVYGYSKKGIQCFGIYTYQVDLTDCEIYGYGADATEYESIGIKDCSTFTAQNAVIKGTGGKVIGVDYDSIGISCGARLTADNCDITAEGGESAGQSYGIKQYNYTYYNPYIVTFNGGTVKAVGNNATNKSYGIITEMGNGTYNSVIVNNTRLEAISGEAPTSKALCTLTLNGKSIVMTASTNSDGSNPDPNPSGYNYKYYKIGQAYNVWIADKRMDEGNCTDILGDGTVSFDSNTNVLTLNNATINAAGNKGYGIKFSDDGIGDLKIRVIGNNTITGKDDGTSYEAYGIYSYYYTDDSRYPSCEIMLDDGAVLNLVTPDADSRDNPHYALRSTGGVTISGKGTVNAIGGNLSGICREGSYGVYVSADKLELKDGAVLNAIGGDSTGTQYNYAGNSYGVHVNGDIIINDGCTLNASSGRIAYSSFSGVTTACNIYGTLNLYGSGSASFSSPCEYGIGIRFNPIYAGMGTYNTEYSVNASNWTGSLTTEGGKNAVFSPNAYGAPSDTVYALTINGDNRKIKAYTELTDTEPLLLDPGVFNMREELEGKYKRLVIDNNIIHKLTKVPAVEATTEKAGNIEYYICSVCGKYFADAEGKNEIVDKSSIIIPKKESPAPTEPVLTPEEAAMPTVEKTAEIIKKTNTDKKDVAGSDYQRLMLKATSKKKAITLKWKQIKGAGGYIIYGAPCGQKMTQLLEIKNPKTVKYVFKKLKKGKYYKYMVVAYKKTAAGNRVITKSKSAHCATPGGKKGNPTGLKIKKSKITLKKGKKTKIKATMTKKQKVATHIAKFRYESSNTKVATVDKKGQIKAKAKGKATIFVYLQNGICKKVKVKVK